MQNRPLVLVALDHATHAARALSVARGLAGARGAEVHVLTALPRSGLQFGGPAGRRPLDSRSAGMDVEPPSNLTPGPVDGDGLPVRRVTLRGRPAHVIPAYARLHQAALLVVQADYGSPRFWRHSRVVDDLARRSPVPVLVLPRGRTSARDERATRRILAPVDFSTASAVALRAARGLSRRHDARVTLVHALPAVPRHLVFSGGEARRVIGQLSAQIGAAAIRLRREAASMGVERADAEVATGDPHRAILETASRVEPDLIVMGVAHRSRLGRVVLGSTLRRLLGRAATPILVVPDVARGDSWLDLEMGERMGRGPRVPGPPLDAAA